MELISRCHKAKVNKGLGTQPIFYQKSVDGETYSYFCTKCGNPCEVEENKIAQDGVYTARDAHNLAQSMWAQKLGTEDCFDFVRRLLNELYELSNK